MEYERIGKTYSQGGGLSPGKLRALLLGLEKRRKQDEEIESKFSLRSNDISDDCKDLDIVSSYADSSTATTEVTNGSMSRDQRVIVSRNEDSVDSDSASSGFEFHKGNRIVNRSIIKHAFAKLAPSKWDDAQKWIASPSANKPSKSTGIQQKKQENFGSVSRQSSLKVMESNVEDFDTKKIDLKQGKTEAEGQKTMTEISYSSMDMYAKPAIEANILLTDSQALISCHESSSIQSLAAVIDPPSTVKPVAMRDMGTEMTPMASQEPSRTGTPVRTSPLMRSPNSSKPSTPRSLQNSIVENHNNNQENLNNEGLNERELQMKTRREIMMLGTQLGKASIALWASREEEEKEASIFHKTVTMDQQSESVIEARAAAWEEAEKGKYMARYHREEIKIQAWENHQKAKTEAEMKKIEVEVERMRAHSHDRLMSKLAAAKHGAEEKRAAAETRRNQEAARAAKQAEYIRRTGRIPSRFPCSWIWCF